MSQGQFGAIGIDPGKSGGIAIVSSMGHQAQAWKMPPTLRDLFDLMREQLPVGYPVYLEKVHAMPKQGVKSTFTFGHGYGALEGMLTALGWSYEKIPPGTWQRAMACLTKGDKNVSKARAQELFPKLRITHATADALLIAEYGRRLPYSFTPPEG